MPGSSAFRPQKQKGRSEKFLTGIIPTPVPLPDRGQGFLTGQKKEVLDSDTGLEG